MSHLNKHNNRDNIIWITWENQRRSVELAKELDAKLHIVKCEDRFKKNAVTRYFFLSLKTLSLIFKYRPRILFVQNPSMVLAGLSCIFRKIMNYNLVIDRHSNFRLDKIDGKEAKWRLFHFLSKYTIKCADLTIVTNEFLAGLVDSWGGNGFILQDKIPSLPHKKTIKLKGEYNIVFVSTFSEDEPIGEVISAGSMINENWYIYITGNYLSFKDKKRMLDRLPGNIVLTGFLPEDEYQSLLYSADLIVVLTNQEHTLTCGAYEAVELSKPLVLSDTKALKDYFSKGVIYTDSNAADIARAIEHGVKEKGYLEEQIKRLKLNLLKDWEGRFKMLIGHITGI